MIAQPALPGFDSHRRQPHAKVADIQRETAAFFRVPMNDLLSARRFDNVCKARHVAMYLARHHTPQSLPAIGRAFHRDHTTVIHALKEIEKRIGEDPAFAARVAELERRI